tara:strand:- start:3432 stop:4025 length:594 start_codon:yes stop_codon:yes gene_type:complete
MGWDWDPFRFRGTVRDAYDEEGSWREARLKEKAKRKEAKGKGVAAEDARLKAEYGTKDREKIAAARSAEALREFEENPFKASGVGQAQIDAQMRAAQAARQASADQLRQTLGLAEMRGQGPMAADAYVAGAKQADLATAADRAAIAQTVGQAVAGKQAQVEAGFMGTAAPASSGDAERMSRALAALAAEGTDEAGTV